jgi:hypothetical protein
MPCNAITATSTATAISTPTATAISTSTAVHAASVSNKVFAVPPRDCLPPKVTHAHAHASSNILLYTISEKNDSTHAKARREFIHEVCMLYSNEC